MFKKDTFRLIRKTANRFISLVCIVFIGVSFMMGLLSTSIIMGNSISKYDNDQKLFDIQLYSSYGFNEDDVDVLSKDEIVSYIYPSKQTDVYCNIGDLKDEKIARFRELISDVNKYDIIYGRRPIKDNEILVLGEDDSLINQKVHVYLKDDNLEEYLIQDDFVIVGVVNSSEYLSKFSNTSNLNNLELGYIFYAFNENFCFDYFTTIYLSIEGSENYNRFSNDYFDFLKEAKDNIEYIALNQQDKLKTTITKDYLEEIEKGEKELEDGRIEGQKKLDEAKQLLDEGNLKLIMIDMEISTIKETINSTISKINIENELIKESEELYNSKVEIIENEYGDSFENIYAKVTSSYATYISLKNTKDVGVNTYLQSLIDNLENDNNNQENIIKINNDKLYGYTEDGKYYKGLIQKKNEEVDLDALEIINKEIDKCNLEIENANNIIKSNNQLIDILKMAQIDGSEDIIDAAIKAIDDEYGGSVEQEFIDCSLIMSSLAKINAEKVLLEEGVKALNELEIKLDELNSLLISSKEEYEKGLKEYKEGLITFQNEIEDGEIKLRKARQDLEDLPEAKWMILESKDAHYDSVLYKNTCSQMRSIGIVMPVLFFLVAALVCLTTMTRLVDEQRGQIGIYCALGFSKKSVITKYATYAFLACIIGSLLAVPVGLYTFPYIIYVTWGILYRNPDIVISMPIFPLIISVLSFTILIVSVTIYVTNRSLKEVPSQLMRPKAPRKAKKVFLEKIPFIWDNLSFTSKITARNIIRYKSRFFMTIIGVAGCTSLLVLGFGIKDSIRDVVNLQYGEIFNYQYTANLKQNADVDMIVEKLEENPLNEKVVPYMTYSSTVYIEDKEDILNVEVINPRDALSVIQLWDHDTSKPLKISNSGVIINAKFAKNNDLSVGDTITITSKGGIKKDVVIDNICEMYFQHFCFISEANYKSLFDESIKYTNIAIVNNESLENVVDEDIEGIAGIFDFSSFTSTFETMITALDYIIIIIILVGGALAFVVLINLTQVNISERIREIATLKVLGFRDYEVNSYIFKEILILTIIGGLIGLPLGKIEEAFVMDVIDMEMVMFPHNIYPLSYLYAYLITFVFTIIVLLFTRKPLRDVEMIESLKSVE